MRGRESGRGSLVPFFFLAAAFCCTFEKVQWNVAGSVFLADVTALGFLFSFAFDRLGRRSGPVPRTAAVLLGFLAAFLLVYLVGFFNLETGQALDQFGKGLVKWLIHFAFLIVGVVYLSRKSLRFYWRTLGWFLGGIAFNGAYGILQLLERPGRSQPRLRVPEAAHPRGEPDQRLRRGQRLQRLPAERAHRRPEPPRDHAGAAAADPDAALSAARAPPPAARGRWRF